MLLHNTLLTILVGFVISYFFTMKKEAVIWAVLADINIIKLFIISSIVSLLQSGKRSWNDNEKYFKFSLYYPNEYICLTQGFYRILLLQSEKYLRHFSTWTKSHFYLGNYITRGPMAIRCSPVPYFEWCIKITYGS